MLATLFVILTFSALYWFPVRRWMSRWGANQSDLARHANERDRNPRAILPSADGIDGEYVSRLERPIHEVFDLLLTIVWRNEVLGPLTDRLFWRVPKDLRECWVDTRDRGVAIDHDDSRRNPREQFAELYPLLLEFVAQADQRLQVPLQDIAAMREDLLVEVAVSIRFVIENADGSEHPADRPEHRKSQVRDHPHTDLGSRLPLIVFQGICDKQRFAVLDHGLAEGSDIHREGLIDWKWISF